MMQEIQHGLGQAKDLGRCLEGYCVTSGRSWGETVEEETDGQTDGQTDRNETYSGRSISGPQRDTEFLAWVTDSVTVPYPKKGCHLGVVEEQGFGWPAADQATARPLIR